ncbi:MAG: hypothetical protein AMXMBFR7_45960 [Planctomycetota bacterium]
MEKAMPISPRRAKALPSCGERTRPQTSNPTAKQPNKHNAPGGMLERVHPRLASQTHAAMSSASRFAKPASRL